MRRGQDSYNCTLCSMSRPPKFLGHSVFSSRCVTISQYFPKVLGILKKTNRCIKEC